MRQYIYYLLIGVIFILIGWFANTAYNLPRSSNNPIAIVRPTPLAKYTIENLSKADIKPAQIEIGKILKDDPKFTSYEFTMNFSPDLSNDLKTTSGLINIPKGAGKFPVIAMFRGYVDPKNYFIGDGTTHSAETFAENGFITIAPDFLGYGDSDREAVDVFESRFQTYVTAITLLKSIESSQSTNLPINHSSIFIWGHSNGGQISLTTLEATGVNYPTVLWAPVSKPFPYSILYYTDDADDGGRFLRQKLADFEKDYDTDLYSLTKYLSNIKAPIQLNQGTADEAVPLVWSDNLNKNLKEATVSAEYIKYPGADHNLTPGWGQAIENALTFYKKHLQ
ncbi:MAG TPA: alpha/beta hydrolase [Patescibacteria group bacterium]|nr:alpha/beta hydrolase [Patescibacteria group bacterium]